VRIVTLPRTVYATAGRGRGAASTDADAGARASYNTLAMRKVEEDAFDDAYELLKKAEVGPQTHTTPLAPLHRPTHSFAPPGDSSASGSLSETHLVRLLRLMTRRPGARADFDGGGGVSEGVDSAAREAARGDAEQPGMFLQAARAATSGAALSHARRRGRGRYRRRGEPCRHHAQPLRRAQSGVCGSQERLTPSRLRCVPGRSSASS